MKTFRWMMTRTWRRETLIAYFDFFLAGGLEALSILRFRRDAWEKSAASALLDQ